MTIPQNLKYTKEHEWAKLDENTVTVGITFHAQELLTDIVFIELPKVGKVVTQHNPLGVVESVKSVSDVFSPVSGEVIEVNTTLEKSPELLNQSPYEKGWIAKIKISNPAELDTLLTANQYESLI